MMRKEIAIIFFLMIVSSNITAQQFIDGTFASISELVKTI